MKIRNEVSLRWAFHSQLAPFLGSKCTTEGLPKIEFMISIEFAESSVVVTFIVAWYDDLLWWGENKIKAHVFRKKHKRKKDTSVSRSCFDCEIVTQWRETEESIPISYDFFIVHGNARTSQWA